MRSSCLNMQVYLCAFQYIKTKLVGTYYLFIEMLTFELFCLQLLHCMQKYPATLLSGDNMILH